MSCTHADAVKTLNSLLETCFNGEEGFRTAANAVTDPQLKQLFTTYAEQRAIFVGELQAKIKQLGGRPAESGGIGGALHRGWMNVKSLVTGGSEAAVLAECDGGEDAAKAVYDDALQCSLPDDVREIVVRHAESIKTAHDAIRALVPHPAGA